MTTMMMRVMVVVMKVMQVVMVMKVMATCKSVPEFLFSNALRPLGCNPDDMTVTMVIMKIKIIMKSITFDDCDVRCSHIIGHDHDDFINEKIKIILTIMTISTMTVE